MASGKFISYYRVSTQQQGKSGLGLAAQKLSVMNYLNGSQSELVAEFTEVESGKKSDTQRPELSAAISLCRKNKASLIVAKLDRLSRDVKNFLEIIDNGIDVRFVDFPDINSGTAEGRLMLTQLASFAEFERRRIGQRTKAGAGNLKENIEMRQQAACDFASKLSGVIEGMKMRGLSQRDMVNELNGLGIKTPTGKEWHLTQLQRTLKRLI